MAKKAAVGGYRPHYTDKNPIIDTTLPPGTRLAPGIKLRRASAVQIMRMTHELMIEQHGECYWCGVAMWHPRWTDNIPHDEQDPDNRATFDHKIPKSKGGPDTKENGVAACWNCNQHRGDMPFEEYEKWTPEMDL